MLLSVLQEHQLRRRDNSCGPNKAEPPSGSTYPGQNAKKPIRQDGLLHLSDAWQFMAGVLPATLRAVAAQRSNPLPADFSSSGECSPADYR
ncbi:hypothetical protein DBZ78_23250 [Salmonella enterica subsp. enterica serovar Brancaster]|uniref:Uncharacterized protein n=4 Tax=Salmonella enterica TaxID=28901 RepID=A0A722PDC9_SALER|nr:hypothetical protein CHD02_15490 [Salmonella enterica subsp. enterica serovar Derby]EAM8793444.1 hypothetical protein [Salmonella enterica]EAY2654304.1 hypothetical protein [Salmonella enterica subsp. enterica serovar Typhimurium]EBR8198872.1 hypothetical protein [Salmonella enterica subsp. enterica serovar Brancaster]EBX8628712.1 hypothetical protein [Salmonella enterica subsp. enterica serovar Kintambo]EBY8084649.1 hypothetical protein [Salmonella enterica subsp. enterica serovar Banana]